MPHSTFLPSALRLGGAAEEQLALILEQEGVKRAILLTDQGLQAAGLTAPLAARLSASGCEVHQLTLPVGEPTIGSFMAVHRQLNRLPLGLIVGVGGGSVMDVAKLCSLLYGRPCTPETFFETAGAASKAAVSVMVPTTCGTGAEATGNAILAFPEREMKLSVVNPAMMPDYVVLDPALTRDLPPAILASTAVDALTHCVECYTSKKANLLSDAYALYGAELIFRWARQAYADGKDLEAKEALMAAALYGGMAITASGTTAVHALSYPLGGKYHIPHGIANAILFAPVMNFNLPACRPRMARLYRVVRPDCGGMSDDAAAQALVREIEALVNDLNIPATLAPYHVMAGDLDGLVRAALEVTRLLQNNPRPMAADDARTIYQQILP